MLFFTLLPFASCTPTRSRCFSSTLTASNRLRIHRIDLRTHYTVFGEVFWFSTRQIHFFHHRMVFHQFIQDDEDHDLPRSVIIWIIVPTHSVHQALLLALFFLMSTPVQDREGRSVDVRKFNFCSLLLFSTTAFSLSVSAFGYCSFANRYVALTANGTAICNSQDEAARTQCLFLLKDHGVGFSGWQGTNPSTNQVECLAYDKTYLVGGTPWQSQSQLLFLLRVKGFNFL